MPQLLDPTRRHDHRRVPTHRRLLAFALVVAGAVGSSLAAGVGPASAYPGLPPDLAAKVLADLPPAGPVVTWTGTVPGTKAYISVVSRGGQIEAYVCDSDKLEVWLKGSLKGGVASAASAPNDVVLSAKASGSTLKGTVRLGGKAYAIQPAKVAWPAGLYKAFGVTGGQLVKAGWVVLPDGSQRGAKLVNGVVAAVSAVDPSSVGLDIDGDGSANPVVPSTPVPFGKKVEKKTKPPTVAEQCAALAKRFDDMMSMHNAEAPGSPGAAAFGNAATQTYQQGMALNCPQFPAPGAQTT